MDFENSDSYTHVQRFRINFWKRFRTETVLKQFRNRIHTKLLSLFQILKKEIMTIKATNGLCDFIRRFFVTAFEGILNREWFSVTNVHELVWINTDHYWFICFAEIKLNSQAWRNQISEKANNLMRFVNNEQPQTGIITILLLRFLIWGKELMTFKVINREKWNMWF